MASGSYAKQKPPRPVEVQTHSVIPQRATRQLPEVALEEEEESEESLFQARLSKVLPSKRTIADIVVPPKVRNVVDEFAPHPLTRHRIWLNPVVICITVGVIFLGVLLSAGIAQRVGDPQLIDYTGGQAYSIQVGGNNSSWQANKPLPSKTKLPLQTGPYAVLGKPTVSANFINRILASYNSPAAGKGQALYNLGVQYGIDPAFAMAFFLHESSFGTAGEATKTLSLGNLRCYNGVTCVDQDRGGYASYPSWEAGFQAWYELIRNYYIAQRGLTTVDTIIPTYAPTADHNDEAAYIASLKHAIDTWHAGILTP